MSEFHGPKCQEMHFPAFSFQNFSGGACPRTPLKAIKPIVSVLQTHNRLLCKKRRLLKTLKKTLKELELIYVRYLDQGSVVNKFLKVHELKDATADGIISTIGEAIEQAGVND